MKLNKTIIVLLFAVAGCSLHLSAQEESTNKKDRKAWEFGVGASAFQFSRVQFSDFTDRKEQGYEFDLKLKHAVYGGNLYVARELNSHFYLDMQGTIGGASSWKDRKDKTKMFFMLGPGLQWRLGEYFGSKYVDPYLRAGVSYMNKGFNMNYKGFEGLAEQEMSWILTNDPEKERKDRTHLLPVSAGAGVNMWLNDHLGIGIQADYLIMPYKNMTNSLQGTARVIWRVGGVKKISR